MELVFVVEELKSEVPMIDNVVTKKVLLRHTIQDKPAQILAHVATNVEEPAAGFESRNDVGVLWLFRYAWCEKGSYACAWIWTDVPGFFAL
jgi:hypothetical protein